MDIPDRNYPREAFGQLLRGIHTEAARAVRRLEEPRLERPCVLGADRNERARVHGLVALG